ncbi:unnamed protein product [Closterium sp. NIES-54]
MPGSSWAGRVADGGVGGRVVQGGDATSRGSYPPAPCPHNPSLRHSQGRRGGMAAVTTATTTTSTITAAQPPSSIPPANHTCELWVACGSAEEALILRNSLAVDAELQPDKLVRVITAHDTHLSISFSCPDARLLRAAFNAFMDSLILAARTIEAFGPPPPMQQPCV